MSTSVDAHPAIDVPLFQFGYLPTFFDAPANPDHPDMRWLAEAFLVRLPDRHTATAVAGFSWGYDLKGAVPAPLPAASVAADHWDAHLDVLRAEYPAWTFHPGCSTE